MNTILKDILLNYTKEYDLLDSILRNHLGNDFNHFYEYYNRSFNVDIYYDDIPGRHLYIYNLFLVGGCTRFSLGLKKFLSRHSVRSEILVAFEATDDIDQDPTYSMDKYIKNNNNPDDIILLNKQKKFISNYLDKYGEYYFGFVDHSVLLVNIDGEDKLLDVNGETLYGGFKTFEYRVSEKEGKQFNIDKKTINSEYFNLLIASDKFILGKFDEIVYEFFENLYNLYNSYI